jgi:probable HAF family extracellular repeat protein
MKAAFSTAVVFFCSTLWFPAGIAAAGPVYSIVQIPDALGQGGINPVAINNSGTVAGTALFFQMSEPFIFSAGNLNLLNIPGTHDTGSFVTGFNNAGQLIGIEQGPQPTGFGWVWLQGTLTLLPDSFGPAGINDAGAIVGGGSIYGAGSLTSIGSLGGSHTSATAINDVGQITGSSAIAGDTANHAFLDSLNPFSHTFVMQDLGTLGGTNSAGAAISGPGLVVGTADVAGGGATHAFLYDAGVMKDLGTLPGFTNFYATAINSAGQVVGTAENLQGGAITASSAFIWLNGVMTDLNTLIPPDSGWVLSSAASVNDAGQITGGGTLNGTPGQGYILTPIPAPPTCHIIGSISPRQLTFIVDDSNSGLQTVAATSSVNANVTVPPFASGSTAPLFVTAVQIDPAQNAAVQISATNVAGTSTSCASTISAGPAQFSGLGGVLISNVNSAADADGRLEVFGLGTDHALWHNVQTTPGGSWGSWSSLGGSSLSGDPSVGTDADGRLEVFVVSSDNQLWNIAQMAPGSWPQTGLQNIASGVEGRPAVVRNSAGFLQVFVRALDNSVVFSTQLSPGSSGWQPLSELGGIITNNPAAGVDNTGTVRVFATGTDQALWNSGLTPGGQALPWTSLGGLLKGDAAIVSQFNLLLVFARADDDSLWYISQTGPSTFSNWTGLGGRMVANPAVTRDSDDRVEAFVIGTDQALWQISQTAPGAPVWSNWTSLGGFLSGSGIAPITSSNGLMNVFVLGGDQGVWEISQSVPGFWN